MEYKVFFCSYVSGNRSGFVRRGTLIIEPPKVTYSGSKAWPFWQQLSIFVGIALLASYFFGFGSIIALIIISYFCNSHAIESIQAAYIIDITRKGRQISFSLYNPETVKLKRTVLKAYSEEIAHELETRLREAKQLAIQNGHYFKRDLDRIMPPDNTESRST